MIPDLLWPTSHYVHYIKMETRALLRNRNWKKLRKPTLKSEINVDPHTLVSVGYESFARFLSVSGYLQNDNSRSFADILAAEGGEGRLTGGSLVTARLLSEELRARGGGGAGGWPVAQQHSASCKISKQIIRLGTMMTEAGVSDLWPQDTLYITAHGAVAGAPAGSSMI